MLLLAIVINIIHNVQCEEFILALILTLRKVSSRESAILKIFFTEALDELRKVKLNIGQLLLLIK